MSNDVRGLLHDAAATPTAPADVAGAWRRGRRMRMQRLTVSGAAIIAIVALVSVAIVNVLPDDNGTSPAVPATTTAPATCATPSTANDIPAWASSARAPGDAPHVVSSDGNVLAALFGSPLIAGTRTDGKQNKILWVVRQPRDGQPLEITATLPGSHVAPVHLSFPANSAPGEIYPGIDDVIAPGCWHFVLAWNGHRSALNIRYVSPETTTTTSGPPNVTVTSTTSTTAATVPSGTCLTAGMTLGISAPTGSAGHFNYEIRFHNNGSQPCTLSGYPGVSYLDASGNQIGVPAQRNPISHGVITLKGGETGYALLSITDPSVLNGCAATPVHELRIYPPNETAAALVTAANGMTVCAAQSGPATSTVNPVLDHPLG